MNRLSILLPALALALALALPGTATTREPVADKTATPRERTTAPKEKTAVPREKTAVPREKTAVPRETTTAPKDKERFQINYYWYTYPADTYNDYEDLLVEELEWWIILLVPINTSSTGGTLIARGYLTDAYPHTMFASEYLYAHY